jgi:hypothetical protein
VAAEGTHLLIRLGLVLLLAAALAGCGGTSRGSLEGSAEATAAETSRFEMNFEIVDPEVEGREFAFRAEGAFDYPNTRGLMTVDGTLPFLGEDANPVEFRLIGRTSYTRWVIKRKSYWVKDEGDPAESDDPVELLIPFPGGPTKPTDVLARAVPASDERETLGTEVIRGVEATHYRLRVDLEKLVKQLPPSDRPEGDVESSWGQRFVPVEIWIDDQSRLRRITIGRSAKEENGTAKETTTVELFDYGVEVDVEAPPEEQLISQRELDELTDDGLVHSSGEADELSPEESCAWARKNLPKKDVDEFCSPPEDKEDP